MVEIILSNNEDRLNQAGLEILMSDKLDIFSYLLQQEQRIWVKTPKISKKNKSQSSMTPFYKDDRDF